MLSETCQFEMGTYLYDFSDEILEMNDKITEIKKRWVVARVTEGCGCGKEGGAATQEQCGLSLW